MRDLIDYVLCALYMVDPGKTVNWNCEECCRQSINECKTFGRLGLECVEVLGHKCSFPNIRFLNSGHKR